VGSIVTLKVFDVLAREVATLVAGVGPRALHPRVFEPTGPSPYNPFNPVTTINYQLPTVTRVTLKMYDVLGCEVAVLVDGVEQPGYKPAGGMPACVLRTPTGRQATWEGEYAFVVLQVAISLLAKSSCS